MHVTQVALQLHVHRVLLETTFQRRECVQQRFGRTLELDHFQGQFVDTSRHHRVTLEELALDLVDVVLQPSHDRRIPVDDLIKDRVRDRFWPTVQQRRAVLQPPPNESEVRCLRMADRVDEVLAGEDVQRADEQTPDPGRGLPSRGGQRARCYLSGDITKGSSGGETPRLVTLGQSAAQHAASHSSASGTCPPGLPGKTSIVAGCRVRQGRWSRIGRGSWPVDDRGGRCGALAAELLPDGPGQGCLRRRR